MKKYKIEVLALVLQGVLFYIFPLFMKRLGPIGVVFLLLAGTFIISVCLGILSKKKIKFLFSPLAAVLFVPSVCIYYNASALVHSAWYFAVSGIGMVVGAGLNKFLRKK